MKTESFRGDSKNTSLEKSVLISNQVSTPASSAQGADEHLCGLGSCRPKCLQIFAKNKVFAIIYGVLLFLHRSYIGYIYAVMSTIQKRYSISGIVMGMILFADNLSAIVISFAVVFVVKKASKPSLLILGSICIALNCLLNTVPYFVYGPATFLLTRDVTEFASPQFELCRTNSTADCINAQLGYLPSESSVATTVMFLASAAFGISYPLLTIAGQTYMDDHTKKKNLPMYFACVTCLEMIGPSAGYLLASWCLTYYEQPTHDPGITTRDPRWVGAWWLGFLVIGVCTLIVSLPIVLFPKNLPGNRLVQSDDTAKATDSNKHMKKELIQRFNETKISLKRLFRNRTYVCRLVYLALSYNAIYGFKIVRAKYIEYHFRVSASKASLFSGPIEALTNTGGMFLAGVLIGKFRPRPVYVAAYSTVCDTIRVIGFAVTLMLGCKGLTFLGTTVQSGELVLENSCNSECSCTTGSFQPVCAADESSVYFSPCYAGCASNLQSENTTAFINCSCIMNASTNTFVKADAEAGYCGESCDNITIFVIVTTIMSFVTATSRIGDKVFGLRCVSDEDRAMSLVVSSILWNTFVFIPFTVEFGYIFDSTCLVWRDDCGSARSCWFYDNDLLRIRLHSVIIGLLSVAVIFEIMMTYNSKTITDFYGETSDRKKRVESEELIESSKL